MKLYLKRLILLVCALISPILARATTAPAISISPGYSTIGVSNTLQYIATVSGLANTAVTWEVNGIVGGNATLGTISPSGLYTAPATVPAAEVLIEAVASNKSTVADVYVVIEPVGPTIASISPSPIPLGNYKVTLTGTGFKPGVAVRSAGMILATTYVNSTTVVAAGYQATAGMVSMQVMTPGTLWGPVFSAPFGTVQTVSPANVTVTIGKTQQFTSSGATSWAASAGTISSNGLYTAPSSLPSNTSVTITAKGPSGSGTATVTLAPVTPQTISPTASAVILGNTLQFTSAGATSWTTSAGTISSNGLYTAPASMPSSASATVTATGPNGFASATVTLVAPQTISPASATVILGKTLQFTSAGATSWTATAGTISSTGLYTAPSTMPSSASVTVTAKGPGGSASATITLAGQQAISPTSASVIVGQTQQFTSSGATSWTATAGTISSTGLYTAPVSMPSSTSVTVTATGPNGSASATVTLIAAQTISPIAATVLLGKTQQFTSTGATSWAASSGTISSTGLYTAPATMPASASVTVTATGPGGSASATVTLAAPLTISPAVASVTIGQSLQFTSVGATSWSATAGSISSTGLYTAPATMPSSASVTVTAAGANGSASATVTLVAASAQTISPQTASVGLGKSLQFTSAGATSWTASVGTITSSGLYVAPGSMPTSPLVTVTAIGPGGSASASVTLTSSNVLTVSPSAVSIALGQTQQFTAPGATSWFASSGSITSTGFYTAPTSLPGDLIVAILASGPNGVATAAVTLVSLNAQTISPTSATVSLGQTQQFTSSGATSWTASSGTVSSTGLFTAPATMPSSPTVSVTATGPNGSATASITLNNPNAQTISPTTATVTLGQTQQFTSTGATSWTASSGTVSSTGLFTAPTTMPGTGTASVTASGPNGSATATISLTNPPVQTISPSSVSVVVGQTQQFTSSGATSWTATAGTISSTGLYTAPASLPAVTTAAVTATGPLGSATATVLLVAGTVTTGQVAITTEAPYYGWELIPGATRRIHATVTNGSTNEVTWTYTTTGGASATITPAPSPNILGAFVDVTLGSVGATCNNIGTNANPVFQSAASVTLTATSVDDPTQSTTVPIQVCNPPVQVFVSPFNVRLYSGQTTDLQSWVWGTVNDNVTWTVTGPSGGNGTLSAPPSGGSATTNRDAVFSATVAGDYTVTATSVASPGVSATAIISVDSAAMPSYAVTPNHTQPVDCSVDPAQSGVTYDVGPGHTYLTIAAVYAALGTNTLNAGTTIRLFNADTTGTNPTRYHEYLRIDGYGTEAAPIRLVGCADSAGNLPILDAQNATAYSPSDNSVQAQIAGLYQVAIHHNGGAFAVYPTMVAPSYIVIEGLAFRNGYQYLPTTSTTPNYFYAPGSSTLTQWSSSSSCIRPYEGDHVTVRGNDIQDCSDGILADFNGNNAWGGFFGDFNLEGNYFNNLGNASGSYHMAYVQGYRQVIQNNVFDQLKPVSYAEELKMRGVAEVVRYNFFNTSTNTRTIDFVEEQDSNMYMSFLGYYYAPSGSVSFIQEYPNDAYTPDLLASADEAWHKAYTYGNVINFGPTTPAVLAPIHFFGDQSPYSDQNTNPPVRVGDLFSYNNTYYSVGGNTMHLVDTMQNQDNQIRWEWPTLTHWNDAVYVGPLNPGGGISFQMSTLRSDITNFGPMWISSNFGTNSLTCSVNTNNACLGTGWPYQMETTQYMDGGNLAAHVSGLSNLIVGGSTVPFSTSTFVPTSGGGLVGTGTALPSTLSNMPVRFQMSAPTFIVTPRKSPLTLGAHD